MTTGQQRESGIALSRQVCGRTPGCSLGTLLVIRLTNDPGRIAPWELQCPVRIAVTLFRKVLDATDSLVNDSASQRTGRAYPAAAAQLPRRFW